MDRIEQNLTEVAEWNKQDQCRLNGPNKTKVYRMDRIEQNLTEVDRMDRIGSM